jgi:urea carboxylase
MDPRHRLVTTKYNPARTWTPENAVGIGGAYMCIYGMEGPGGYQLFGRTIQVWNSWRTTSAFQPGKPWLLDYFDQIRFFPVSHDELTEARAAFPHGAYPVRIEQTQFSYADYARNLTEQAPAISAFKHRQQAAFDGERQRWKDEGLDTFVAAETPLYADAAEIPMGCIGIAGGVPGSLWKMLVEPGSQVAAGDVIAIVESMKMEIAIPTHQSGRVRQILVSPGQSLRSNDVIAIIEETV